MSQNTQHLSPAESQEAIGKNFP